MTDEPRTEAGRRLLWMVATERVSGSSYRRAPTTFDARLVERIVQEFVPRIEREAMEQRAADPALTGDVR